MLNMFEKVVVGMFVNADVVATVLPVHGRETLAVLVTLNRYIQEHGKSITQLWALSANSFLKI